MGAGDPAGLSGAEESDESADGAHAPPRAVSEGSDSESEEEEEEEGEEVTFRLWIDLPRERKKLSRTLGPRSSKDTGGGDLVKWGVCSLCFLGPLVA